MAKSTDKSRESSRRRENCHGMASHDHANGEEHLPNEVSSSGISPSSGGRPKRRLRIRVRMPAVSPPSPNASVQASKEKASPSRIRKKRISSHGEEAKADTVQLAASKKRRTNATRTRKAKQHPAAAAPSSASDAKDILLIKNDKAETRSTPDMETEDEVEGKTAVSLAKQAASSPSSKTATTPAKVPAQKVLPVLLPRPPTVPPSKRSDPSPKPVPVKAAPSTERTAAALSGGATSSTSLSSSLPASTDGQRPVTYSKVTIEDIRNAIPEDASCVVHIMDRRVNFDSCSPDASCYTLLRSWVQDDPFRQIPPPCSNIFECISLPSERRAEHTPAIPKTKPVKVTGTCDVFSSMKTDETKSKLPLVTSLRHELIVKSKRLRYAKQRVDKAWIKASRQSLKSIGIDLPLNT